MINPDGPQIFKAIMNGDVSQSPQTPKTDEKGTRDGIKLEIFRKKSGWKKLDPSEITPIELPDNNVPLFTSGIKQNPDGTEELLYLLRTKSGSVFALQEDDPFVQELKAAAANVAIDAFETESPLAIAGSIKDSIKKSGFEFDGGPLDAWQFAIDAMSKMREFQEIQLQVIHLNIAQTAGRQLQKDIGLPLHKFAFLPPHRRIAAMIFTETCMVLALQDLTDENSVQTARNIKDMNIALAERRAQLMEMWVDHISTTIGNTINKGGEVATDLLKNIMSRGGEGISDFGRYMLKFVFGEEAQDEGAIRTILEHSGEAGEKLLALIGDSGLTINAFFRNLFSKGEVATKSRPTLQRPTTFRPKPMATQPSTEEPDEA